MRTIVGALVMVFLFGMKAGAADEPDAAVFKRDAGRLRALLAADPTLAGKIGATGLAPLHRAAVFGWKEGVEILLDAKVDPSLPSSTGETALHYASEKGEAEVVRLLLERGAAVDARDGREMTPLHLAAKWGRLPVLELLLEHKADPDAHDRDWRTPLHWVAREGKDVEEESSNYSIDFTLFGKCARALLAKGAAVNALDDLDASPLAVARKANGLSRSFGSVYVILSEAGGKEETRDILPREVPALFQAVEKGDGKTVAALLDKDPALGRFRLGGTTPLHKAAWSGQKEIVALLLDRGVDVDLKKKGAATPLYDAAFRGHGEIVGLLLARGARPDGFAPDSTPLHGAVVMDETEVMEQLLKAGANPDACSPGGQSPLFVAAREGRAGAAGVLIAHGADVNRQDRSGNTPLSIARQFGQDEVATLLESKGAK